MADAPSPEPKEQTEDDPKPEVLLPRESEPAPGTDNKVPASDPKPVKRPRNTTYHLSHKATFIGLAVMIAMLSVSAGIVFFVLKSHSGSKANTNQDQVTISQGTLDKLGVNRTAVGDLGALLTVGPDAKFNGALTVGKDVSIAGQLKLNSKFTASDASLTQLEAGNTSLSKLNVNGDSTVSNLNLRNDLQVTGTSRLQGPVIVSQLLTVNNNANISGSLSVGGILSVNSLHVGGLTTDTTLTIGGHVITRGNAPGISRYAIAAFGSNGTVSISGTDAAGTIGINIGANPSGGGCFAHVTFVSSYATTPHVVISAMGNIGYTYVQGKTAAGFDVCASGPTSPGGYTIDYIVEQ